MPPPGVSPPQNGSQDHNVAMALHEVGIYALLSYSTITYAHAAHSTVDACYV